MVGVKAAVERAAVLSGADKATLTLSAALQETERVVKAHEYTRLETVDHAALFSTFNSTTRPYKALKHAAKRYKSGVVSP